jgi:hypothetical protein
VRVDDFELPRQAQHESRLRKPICLAVLEKIAVRILASGDVELDRREPAGEPGQRRHGRGSGLSSGEEATSNLDGLSYLALVRQANTSGATLTVPCS